MPGWPLEPWCCWCPECLLSGYTRFGRLRAIQCSWAFCSCCPRSADPVAPLWTYNNILRHSGDRGPYVPQYARKEGRRRRGRGRTCKKQDHRGPYVEKKQFWRLEYGGYIWRSDLGNFRGVQIWFRFLLKVNWKRTILKAWVRGGILGGQIWSISEGSRFDSDFISEVWNGTALLRYNWAEWFSPAANRKSSMDREPPGKNKSWILIKVRANQVKSGFVGFGPH